MTGYRLRPRAAADIEAICEDIARVSPGGAKRFATELAALFERLAEFPNSFQRRDDLRTGLRQALYPPYLVLFAADDDSVVIVRLVYGARRLEDLI